jgi:dipeptidyl aminopeptidase/acylaminoacyl peptidase
MLLSLLATATFALSADTLTLSELRATPPTSMTAPYHIDSLNHRGKAFDAKTILDQNSLLAQLPLSSFPATTAQQRSATADYTLQAYRFAINSDRFVKARLQVTTDGLSVLYVDGKQKEPGEWQFTPGRTWVTLLTLDTLHRATTSVPTVQLMGDDLTGVTTDLKQPEAYTMAHMLRGDHYRDVSLSPTGDYLLTHYYKTAADGTHTFRTVVTAMATGREVVRREGFVAYHWWPKRDVLYWTRAAVEGGYDLVTYDPATGRETVVATRLPAADVTLSPSGDYAIITRSDEAPAPTVVGLRRLYDPDDRTPGGRRVTALWRYDFSTHTTQPLTYGHTSPWLNDISSDGRRLLLAYSRQDPARTPFTRTTLVEVDAYTLQADTLLRDTTYISSALYSPDGRRLLITASPEAFDGIGLEVAEGQTASAFDNRLYLYDIATQHVTPALPHFRAAVGRVLWASGDGNIYFRATEGCDEGLFRLNPKTLRARRFDLPISYVQDFTISTAAKTPRAVVFGQTGERAREMYSLKLPTGDTGGAVNATRIGEIDFDQLYAGVAIGTCHDWTCRSSRGDTISGFYFLPPDFDATRQYPLIVYYYGGCTPTGKMLEFQYPLQVLAGQGYVVYVCEPSGAIGYGQEFAARHVGAWGQGTAEDIIEATRAFLAEHPYVRADKVGCMGASYGGFMTQYLQTRTDIFAAAISHAGISNIASYWGGGYWGYTYGEAAQMGSYPWNNADLYVQQSPLFHADKIHTPLLLLHGTADTNVPTNESQQLYTALRILHRPVSYVQVDGENHVITDYRKRLAWQDVIFAWMARWLKDQPQWWSTLFPDDDFGLSHP